MIVGLLIVSVTLIILGLLYFARLKHQRIILLTQKTQTILNELNDLKEAHQEAQHQLTFYQEKLRLINQDPVAKVLGWQLFNDRLHQSVKESTRHQLTLGVIMVDIDDFHVINDGLNQQAGDRLLQEVAERLKSCIRQVDSITRLTKDTFVILLTQLAKPETAAIVVQRMLNALELPFELQEKEWYITACAGVSIYPDDAQDTAALLRNADYALQIAKQKGKQTYQFYQEQMHANSCRELTLYNSLHRETVFQEFVIYYQPIMNMQNESIFCMDALVYWNHPELGLLAPEELQYYADRQHRLNTISEWQIKKACQQFLLWRSQGFQPACLGISVSIKQLENSHFICNFSQILQELQFKPEWLLLVINDHVAPLSFDLLEKSFNRLKYLGIKLAIHYFGAGAISLYHLKQFAVDYLKLERSLIDDLANDHRTADMMKAIFFLAESMSTQLIVQGIETSQQVTILKNLGYSLMQGNLIGGPLSEAEVTSTMIPIAE